MKMIKLEGVDGRIFYVKLSAIIAIGFDNHGTQVWLSDLASGFFYVKDPVEKLLNLLESIL